MIRLRPTLPLLALAAGLLPALPAEAAPYEPVDCAKAALPAEVAVCRSVPLAQADAHMATMFAVTTSLVAMGERGELGDHQRAWLKTRDSCGADAECLAKAYRERAAELGKVFDAVVKRGPF